MMDIKLTPNGYIKAVKAKFDTEKQGLYGSLLAHPTPATLRDLCLVLHDTGLSYNDKVIFKHFFQPKEAETLRKVIEKDIDKFRTVQNFLNGKNEKPNMRILDLVAVLVDFNPRPYSNYIQNPNPGTSGLIKVDTNSIDDQAVVQSGNTIGEKDKRRNKSNILIYIGLALVLLAGGYLAKAVYSADIQCMQWQEDHYAITDCNTPNITFQHNPIQPLNEKLLQFRKIKLMDTTQLFEHGKPLVWYCKQHGEPPEFFNGRGVHPVTGKDLKPITPYMAKRYAQPTGL